jgi:gamma-glutamyltranspeptidase/glutathione hydrolase
VKPTGCELGLENRVPPEVRAALETKGHRIGLMGAFNLIYTGAGQAVMHDSATGLNAGASDPRADGAAVPGRPQ